MHDLESAHKKIKQQDRTIARLTWATNKLEIVCAVRNLLPRLALQLFFTVLCLIFGLLPTVSIAYSQNVDITHSAIAIFAAVICLSGAVINAILTRDIYLEMRDVRRFHNRREACIEMT